MTEAYPPQHRGVRMGNDMFSRDFGKGEEPCPMCLNFRPLFPFPWAPASSIDALVEMTAILDGLVVFADAMMYNLESSGGLTFSQQVLLKLVEKGLDRQVAYKLVQKHAMKAWRERVSFIEGLKSDPEISARISPAELEGVFDYGYHLKHIDTAFQRLGLNAQETKE